MNIDKYDKIETKDGVIILTPKKEDLDWILEKGADAYLIYGTGIVDGAYGSDIETYLRHHNAFKIESQGSCKTM